MPAEAKALEQADDHHLVKLDDGTSISGRTVVVATGARYRRLEVPRLEQFEETSVYYAATPVEARVCRDDPVVVGGGNSAGQATLFLSRFAARLHLVVREDDLGRNMSRYLVDRICSIRSRRPSSVSPPPTGSVSSMNPGATAFTVTLRGRAPAPAST